MHAFKGSAVSVPRVCGMWCRCLLEVEELIKDCLTHNAEKRLSMKEVIERLRGLLD